MPGPHDRFDSARSVCGNTRSQRLVDAASVKEKISSFHKRAGRNAGPFCLSSSFQKGLIDRFRRSVIPLSRKIMSLRSFAICTASLFVSSVCAVAGSAAGGGAQIAPTDNASVSTYKATDTSAGASARDSAGASSLSSGGSSSSSSSSGSSAGASSTDASSSSGSTSSNGGAPSGFGIGPQGAKN